MGVEHYLVCNDCKQYIDLHKAYEFGMILRQNRPSPGVKGDIPPYGYIQDIQLRGSYWESRGLWFIWQHRGHKGVEMRVDTDELHKARKKLGEFLTGIAVGFIAFPLLLVFFSIIAYAWQYWWDVKKGHLGE